MKLIFLDIDGVLSTPYSVQTARDIRKRSNPVYKQPTKIHTNFEFLDNLCLHRFNKFILDTDAKIVISSTWRKLFSLEQLQAGFASRLACKFANRIIGVTPKLSSGFRGFEVAEYLRTAPFEVTNMVIIDDDNDFLQWQTPHLVLTKGDVGFDSNHIAESKKKLNLPYKSNTL